MRSEAIDPAGVAWNRVDPKYIPVGYITGGLGWLWFVVPAAAAVVLQLLDIWSIWPWLMWTVIGVLAVWMVVDLILWPRRARAIGYFERQDDLLVRRGLLWQRVVAVPYGRLQYVDIEAGPIMRKFGICTVKLKTASADTDAEIPGISRSEGARLRDELSARGQARLAGL